MGREERAARGGRPLGTLLAGGPDGVPVEAERKHVRRLNLRVRADGSAHLSVPLRCPLDEAQRFLDAHEAWLRERVGRRAAATDPAPDGRVPLWGSLVELPAGAAPDELYRRELAARLPEVAARMEAALGVHASAWQLRAMSSRWGSCTPATGHIRVNVRLAAYPPTCLDYVVAHELTHLREPSHNARFHVLLAGAYPDERGARALLRADPKSLASGSLADS
ncbi:M48 family metallopeptidase [Olsenella profusa]|uniref:M48 family metallopeptidase n=1 Tax=Olsenella profusa TaxID=138595 RepID=A0ABS2F381_9ACTN|nr:SprT family zinc-dependent metalloprotease [Olsenella profusa]MBM6775350.1 M48 family metallopeptidase [Olsenella profusa]